MTSGRQSEVWEEAGWIELCTAICAFGDAARIPPDFSLQPGLLEQNQLLVEDATSLGIPLVACNTTEDGAFDVEVLRDEGGEPVAARICFTNDVDQLRGRWVAAGRFEITGGRGLAADPYCSPKEPYRFEFELSNGTYVAEVFEYTDPQHGWDVLGLRIRREDIVLSSDQR